MLPEEIMALRRAENIQASRAPSEYEWRRLHERLDRAVAEAARFYLQGLATRGISVDAQKCSEELAELRFGREPDYDLPGLPLLYALKYMPRRVVCTFGSLLSVLDSWYPTSVLDIGSGPGTTALAMDLLNLPRHINLVGIEPSREMITFSESSRYRDRVSAVYRQGAISDLIGGDIPFEPFDLLVFSACLPYSFDDWNPLLTALGGYEGCESKMILMVEPGAKAEFLTSFARQLRARGWPTVTFCCHDLPDVVKDDGLPLRNMMNVWWRLGLDEASRPRTWWNPPDDKFLIANPNPGGPSGPLAVLSSTAKTGRITLGGTQAALAWRG
jgi:SAM-dependent methyltransferase